ncbi:TauD/TfdA family dioxygenase [Streptomyces sp. NPDC046465]|uniref:TauD/TfdA family dioxygenase n=1 Tax=Streptomyces sp. NPDC046465 TaxID=3155810 RepID=UPI0033C1A32F
MSGDVAAGGRRAWDRSSLRRADWLVPVDQHQTALRDEGRAALAAGLDERLRRGSGVAVLRGLDLAGRTDDQCVDLCHQYLALAGRPRARSGRHADDLLTAATAPAAPPTAPAPSNGGDAQLLAPHTDRSDRAYQPRLLALLCIRPGAQGGETLLVSGATVLNRLRERHPGAVRELHGDFHFGRGDGFVRRYPVFRQGPEGLRVHYNRHWIHRGHQEADLPLSSGQRAALDAFDAHLTDARLTVRIALGPGDLLIVDNGAVLHGRTPFSDHHAPGRRRCLARAWAD